jgi:selenocysteine-specific elongation factor
MKSLVLGTAGHVDHGKTTLVRALTGIDTDRLQEEKDRGLTIDIGFAHLDISPEIRAGIVDVPGHHDFLSNMLAGSTGIDAVLLVVAAHEGPMPQTREHLQIASLLGLTAGVIALTHVDRVDSEFADLAGATASEEVLDIIGREWPVVQVDATRGSGLDSLRAELLRLAENLPEPTDDPVFRLPVDRSFTIAGAGTVVTGTIWSGEVSAGNRVRILPSGREARIRSLQVHGEEHSKAGPRQRCAASLVGTSRSEVERGDTIVADASWKPSTRLGVALRMLEGCSRPVQHGQRIRLFLGTGETMARVSLSQEEALEEGDVGGVVLDCETPVVARVGDPMIIRFYSPVELLGGGRVGELNPPGAWRDRVPDWYACLGSDPQVSVEAALRLAGAKGLTSGQLRLATPHKFEVDLSPNWSVLRIGDRLFDPEQRDLMSAQLGIWMKKAHEESPLEAGLALQSLRAAGSQDAAPQLIKAAIRSMADSGEIVIEGPHVRLAGHSVDLTEEEQAIQNALVEAISTGGLMPPAPADLVDIASGARPLLNALLKLLVEDGVLVQLTPDLLLTASAERDMVDKVLRVLKQTESPPPSAFREALGVTRRYLIPMLEYLDAIGWTERTSDGRIPGLLARAAMSGGQPA